jgi:hypothetical protein
MTNGQIDPKQLFDSAQRKTARAILAVADLSIQRLTL